MTDDEWRSSTDPRAMCEFVRTATTSWKTRWLGWLKTRRFQVSERRWRLIELVKAEQAARGMCIAELAPELAELLPAARRHAEGRLGPAKAAASAAAAMSWLHDQLTSDLWMGTPIGRKISRAAAAIGRIFADVAEPYTGYDDIATLEDSGRTTPAEEAEVADGVRDILGYLFVADPIDPAWLSANDGAARSLVESIDACGDYRDLPVLADALEDAGCGSEAILSHCRQPTRHVRGCWVVDRLLGRE